MDISVKIIISCNVISLICYRVTDVSKEPAAYLKMQEVCSNETLNLICESMYSNNLKIAVPLPPIYSYFRVETNFYISTERQVKSQFRTLWPYLAPLEIYELRIQ